MKSTLKVGAAFAILSPLLLAGCNNARIPDGGKVMRDSDGNEYLIKFHIGNVYTIDPIPAKPEMNTPNRENDMSDNDKAKVDDGGSALADRAKDGGK